jgi:hypothetical protein
MNSWAIKNPNFKPHAPERLASTDDARAIALLIFAGESLGDHQVHARAWVRLISGRLLPAAHTVASDKEFVGHS